MENKKYIQVYDGRSLVCCDGGSTTVDHEIMRVDFM